MYLHALATALPEYSFSQKEIYDLFMKSQAFGGLRGRSKSLVEKVLLGDSGIERRHFCHNDPDPLFAADGGLLARSFEQHAPALASQALQKALHQAGITAEAVDALFICTCTGYLCPGPSSHIAEKCGLRPDAALYDLVGLGCGAAIPTLRAASHFLAAHPDATVAVIAVEICSSAFLVDDDPGQLISLCLFGDGAAAAVFKGAKSSTYWWKMSHFRSLHRPSEREKIRFVNEGGKLKNQLHRSVPALAAEAVKELRLTDEALGLPNSTPIIAHPGGRDVLLALREVFPTQDFTESSLVLRECGNMSSPSVLFALENALDTPQSDRFWLTAFGAGFSAHSCQVAKT